MLEPKPIGEEGGEGLKKPVEDADKKVDKEQSENTDEKDQQK